jgi:aminoglycoside/choline kinase family phosphotransferase
MSEALDIPLLSKHFQALTGAPPASVKVLKPHASDRRIYRLTNQVQTVVGVVNANSPENEAFVYLAGHFRSFDLPVPEVYHFAAKENLYLLRDLGDTTLLDFLLSERARTSHDFPESVACVYRQVLEHLVTFQVNAARSLDFNRCYPESLFSSPALLRDMIKFERELVARLLPDDSSTNLKTDFRTLVEFLAKAQSDFFLYRDFQSRNIMLVDQSPYFIDFQAGRKGPLQYDVVSLLYQSSTQLPENVRARLLEHYLDAVQGQLSLDRSAFMHYYSGFIVSRMLQVLGVYGSQGLGAGKEYFTKSIPGALHNLLRELTAPNFPINLPTLRNCAERLATAFKGLKT